MAATKLTPPVLAEVRSYVEQGLSAAEIAPRVGCTIGTLRVTCCKHKISLRRKKRRAEFDRGETVSGPQVDQPRRRHRPVGVTVSLPQIIIDLLREHAAARQISCPKLIAMLLTAIARDKLYSAVLDE